MRHVRRAQAIKSGDIDSSRPHITRSYEVMLNARLCNDDGRVSMFAVSKSDGSRPHLAPPLAPARPLFLSEPPWVAEFGSRDIFERRSIQRQAHGTASLHLPIPNQHRNHARSFRQGHRVPQVRGRLCRLLEASGKASHVSLTFALCAKPHDVKC